MGLNKILLGDEELTKKIYYNSLSKVEFKYKTQKIQT